MKFLGLITFLTGIIISSQSYGLIEGQILLGQRAASLTDSGDLSGMETKLSVYVDPIPLIPVGAGLSFANVDLGSNDNFSSLEGSEISLDITAWIPLGIAGFKPYAKLGYIVSGEYTQDVSGTSISADSSGTKVSAGLKYSFLPLIAVMIEVEKSNVTLKYSEGEDIESDNLSVFIGAAVGI